MGTIMLDISTKSGIVIHIYNPFNHNNGHSLYIYILSVILILVNNNAKKGYS